MVDLHAHILPGLDDGPEHEDGALALARAAVAGGTRVLAATPHVNERFDPSPAEIAAAAERLHSVLAAAGVELELVTGAEVAQTRLADLDDAALAALSIAGRGYVLLECEPPAGDVEADVRRLLERGHGVVLAHAERCRAFRADPATVERLVAAGALVSVTAASFGGAFGPGAQRLAFALLEAGLVHNVASDAHDAVGRPPELAGARSVLRRRLEGMDSWWPWLVADVPAAIIGGHAPPPPPAPPPSRRGGLGGLLRR